MVTFNKIPEPRDLAILAALRDLGVIAAILDPAREATADRRVVSSAPDDHRAAYLRVLGEYVVEFGGRLEEFEGQPVAVFGDRRIFIPFSRYA